jgi:hypothetical protein
MILFNRPYVGPTFILNVFISGADDLILAYTWKILQFIVHLTEHGRKSIGKAILLSETSKAFPVTGRGGPQRCEISRLPHFLDNSLTDGGEAVSLTRRPPFTARKIPGIDFCYWLCRLQGHSAAGRIRSIEKKTTNDLIGNRTRDFRLVAQCQPTTVRVTPLETSIDSNPTIRNTAGLQQACSMQHLSLDTGCDLLTVWKSRRTPFSGRAPCSVSSGWPRPVSPPYSRFIIWLYMKA